MAQQTATAERVTSTLTAQGFVLSERGLRRSGGQLIILSAAEIASPLPEILALIYDTFQLDVAPYTRYRSTGTALLAEGTGSGGGSSNTGIDGGAPDSNFTSTTPIEGGTP
jgi:hypothetical protein